MVKNILRGILVGIANIIPGVSGGTMMVSMGMYDKLIYAITHLFKDFKNSMKILLPILVGAGIGIAGLSFVIEYLFENYPIQTNLLFIGLIIGSLPIILGKVKGAKKSIGNILAFLFFFGVVVVSALMGEAKGSDVDLTINVIQIIKLFGVGLIASATMVIPGVSGSMVLLLMGYYDPIIKTISSFIKAVFAFSMPDILHGMSILVPFGIGIVIGIFAIAKLIEIMFEKYPMLAYHAIIGLIVASPIGILLMADLGSLSFLSILTGIVALLAGCVVAYKLGGE